MNDEHKQNIESRLTQTFQRVTPSSAFVNTVRNRINKSAPTMTIEKFSEKRRNTLRALGGVLSVSLLILTVARVVYYLIGRSKQAA
jgi:type IV secretory pathway VirB6-like protein